VSASHCENDGVDRTQRIPDIDRPRVIALPGGAVFDQEGSTLSYGNRSLPLTATSKRVLHCVLQLGDLPSDERGVVPESWIATHRSTIGVDRQNLRSGANAIAQFMRPGYDWRAASEAYEESLESETAPVHESWMDADVTSLQVDLSLSAMYSRLARYTRGCARAFANVVDILVDEEGELAKQLPSDDIPDRFSHVKDYGSNLVYFADVYAKRIGQLPGDEIARLYGRNRANVTRMLDHAQKAGREAQQFVQSLRPVTHDNLVAVATQSPLAALLIQCSASVGVVGKVVAEQERSAPAME